MPDILTLTMNPALDVFTSIDTVIATHKLRCAAAQTHPGGGGINVARVIHRLGGDVLALFPAGGVTGRVLQELVQGEQIPHRCIAIEQETRESFSVHENSSGQDFRFVLPGPCLSEAEWAHCLDEVARVQPQPGLLVASGSLPPGVPDDFYARVARQVASQGTRLVLDTSGPALAQALEAGVYLVKPSLRELRDLTGLALENQADWCAASRQLIQTGQAQVVALSLGADGALLVTQHGAWRAFSLTVDVASTIGAGDSFLAGLVWALKQGHPPEQALSYAMAAGAAALLSPGTALCHPQDVARLRQAVRVEPA